LRNKLLIYLPITNPGSGGSAYPNKYRIIALRVYRARAYRNVGTPATGIPTLDYVPGEFALIKRILVNNIPQTQTGTNPFYWHSSISNAVWFIDDGGKNLASMSDYNPSVTPPIDVDGPPHAFQYLALHHERLWGAGSANAEATTNPARQGSVYYSRPFPYINQWRKVAGVYIDELRCSERPIRALKEFQGRLFWWTDTEFGEIIGSDEDTYLPVVLSHGVGCASHWAVIAYDNHLYWYSEIKRAIIKYDGTTISIIPNLEGLLVPISGYTEKDLCHAVANRWRNEIWFCAGLSYSYSFLGPGPVVCVNAITDKVSLFFFKHKRNDGTYNYTNISAAYSSYDGVVYGWFNAPPPNDHLNNFCMQFDIIPGTSPPNVIPTDHGAPIQVYLETGWQGTTATELRGEVARLVVQPSDTGVSSLSLTVYGTYEDGVSNFETMPFSVSPSSLLAMSQVVRLKTGMRGKFLGVRVDGATTSAPVYFMPAISLIELEVMPVAEDILQ
jgi:hypothetical protein